MKTLLATGSLLLAVASVAAAQTAPAIVWSAPTPGLGANDVAAVAWSPTDDGLAVGSSDRWFRLRVASTGELLYSILEPKNSGGPGNIIFSDDGQLIGVRNQSSGLGIRVQRMTDGLFLGSIVGTVGANGLVSFAPDSMLVATIGPSLAMWDFSELTLHQVTGSGYQKVFTDFDLSPDGRLQAASSKGFITVRRTSDGKVLKVLRGKSPVKFSHDSSLLSAVNTTPVNEVVIWKTGTWSILHQLVAPSAEESSGNLRFTPDDQRLVATGYSPYLDGQGLWQQNGFIRFWSVATGAELVTYDAQTDLAVTSPVAFSPDGSQYAYGLYDGTVAVATTP
ncbi:MAG TPA: hypothetical protein VFY71_03685 [Planctomycetota bacterium]|nr:hypothetical protein [Planctomycetota bacterium]